VATSVFGFILSPSRFCLLLDSNGHGSLYNSEKALLLGGWVAEAFGYSGFQEALALIGLIKILSLVLLVIAIVSIITDLYVYAKKDSFSEELVKSLP
jgi:hypothetical protein